MNRKKTIVKILAILFWISSSHCASLPEVKHKWYAFPKNAYFGVPKRPFKSLGSVKAREDYPTLDPENDEKRLCINYFNKAVAKLVRYAKKQGADAVIDVRSVTIYIDGNTETHPRAECVDEGSEGQVLTQGVAVKWLPKTPKKRTRTKHKSS